MKEGIFRQQIASLLLIFALGASSLGLARGGFEVLKGKQLADAIPRDFYLEGSALPVEKRNATLIETPSGRRVLVALVVTSGWASQLPHKYSGLLITEGPLSVCGNPLAVGSYGFGLHRPVAPSGSDAEFVLYNQAGQKVWDCAAKKDLQLKEPRPLQVLLDTSHFARLYLGRYWVQLRP